MRIREDDVSEHDGKIRGIISVSCSSPEETPLRVRVERKTRKFVGYKIKFDDPRHCDLYRYNRFSLSRRVEPLRGRLGMFFFFIINISEVAKNLRI